MTAATPVGGRPDDEQWALIEPVIIAWKVRHCSVGGHQGAYEMREIVNAILCQGRTGCQWVYLPHDLPPGAGTGSDRRRVWRRKVNSRLPKGNSDI